MANVTITRHAEKRMQQRGIRNPDIDILLRYGDEIEGQGLLISNKTAAEIVKSLKSQIAAVERLRNTKIVVDGGTLITCYPCGKGEKRRMKKLTRQS